MFEIYHKETGLYRTNSFILKNKETSEAAVVDPGVYDRDFRDFLNFSGVTELKYIFLTHGHFDHICGAYPLKKAFGGEILIHEADALCLSDTSRSLCSAVKGYVQDICSADKILHEGDEISLGSDKITVMHTPGHTPGSIMYICDSVIFSGDTLFRCSMGRTDLAGGSTKTLFSSLRRIGQMEGDYRIFPGHGDETTLLYEKRNNRYLRANDTLHR